MKGLQEWGGKQSSLLIHNSLVQEFGGHLAGLEAREVAMSGQQPEIETQAPGNEANVHTSSGISAIGMEAAQTLQMASGSQIAVASQPNDWMVGMWCPGWEQRYMAAI